MTRTAEAKAEDLSERQRALARKQHERDKIDKQIARIDRLMGIALLRNDRRALVLLNEHRDRWNRKKMMYSPDPCR